MSHVAWKYFVLGIALSALQPNSEPQKGASASGTQEKAQPGLVKATERRALYKKGQTRIMPLGDSITNAPGWRVDLQDLLKKDGFTFRMVGGRNDPLLAEGYWSDHGGSGGWTIGAFPSSQEFGGADVDWIGSRPDLVLLMIGTNDMQWGQTKGAPERLGQLLDKIWADVLDAVVLVARITPFAPGSRVNDKPDGDRLDPLVREYNAAIPGEVARRVAAGKRAAVVDQYTGFDPAKDLADKCHPNKSGHHKLARKWLDAIRDVTIEDRDYPDRELPPIVRASIDAGGPKLVAVGGKVRLVGTLEDGGGKDQKVTYTWRKLCGPADVAFDAADRLTTTASFPAAGSYCLALTASNGKAEGRGDVCVVVTKTSGEGDDVRPGKAGGSIGINFGTAMHGEDAAGVVPRPHWNAAKLREATVVSVKNLLDDRGKATTASYRFWGNNAGPGTNSECPDSPDGRLLSGRYDGSNPVSHRLRDVPFRRYDLYLYFYQAVGGKPDEAEFVHRFQLRDLDTDQTVVGPVYAKNMSSPFEKWARGATNQTADRKENTPSANYLLIQDLGARNVEIQTGGPGDSWAKKAGAHSSLCGIQVVERLALEETKDDAKPEPARPTVNDPLPVPGMGWSTYNFFGARHNEGLFKGMATAFADSGLRDAGYTILRIDGGWWGDDGNRRSYYWTEAGKYAGGSEYSAGDPHVDPKNYPGGIKPLADHLHKKGLKLGFYLAPALSTGASDNYPGNKDRKEQPTVKGLKLIDQHARWVADSGIDHLFYDGYDWSQEKGTEPYTRLFSALRKGAKRVDRPIVFSINTGWLGRPRDYADEWRTSPDINAEWKTILECLATVAEPKPAGRGRWNNPDYLMVGFLGDEEAKSQMSLWCVAGAPLYVSHDFRVLNDWDRYVLLNTEAIAVDRDPAKTPGHRLRTEGAAQVWVRPLADGSKAVVLLNAGDKPLTVGVGWAELGLPPGTVQVRDLWAHKNLGTVEKEFTAKDLPPRGCAFIRVVAGDKPPPELKATWAPHPGKKPDFKPLATEGWKLSTDLSRKDDPLSNLADADPKTGYWSPAESGKRIDVDLGKPFRFDRILIDHKGVGPNPWPYKVHAPRSGFTLEVSEDGKTFSKAAENSFGPEYTIITFKSLTARHVRIVLGEIERTSAYGDVTWSAKDIYLFDTSSQPR